MSIFAVEYTYDDRRDLQAEVRPAHREFLFALEAAGTLLASGPLEQGAGALILVVADDEEGALRLLDDDPFQAEGLVSGRRARSWLPVIGPFAGR